jgi:hypothetical protein
MKVLLHKDRTRFTMVKGSWRQTCPVADLTAQIAFYTRMADPKRTPKGWTHYTETIAALRAVKAKLEAAP